MSNWSDAIDGLGTVVQNGVTGVHAYNHPTDSVEGVPAVVVLPETMDPELAFGGNSFEGTLRLVVLIAAGDSSEAFAQLYDYLDPTVANKSIIKAIRDAPTLNGKVDASRVDRIENIGRRQIGGGWFSGFDVIVDFVKSVA